LAFKENKSLKVLNLSRNNLTDVAGVYIAVIIEENKGLHILYFSHNKLSDRSMKNVSNALLKNTSLNILSFSNKISDLGVKFLMEAFILNTALKINDLMLVSNNIKHCGAKLIACALSRRIQNLRVDLTNNKITNNGARFIIRKLSYNPEITFDLEENLVSQKLLTQIKRKCLKFKSNTKNIIKEIQKSKLNNSNSIENNFESFKNNAKSFFSRFDLYDLIIICILITDLYYLKKLIY
jgi:hypothetical protein